MSPSEFDEEPTPPMTHASAFEECLNAPDDYGFVPRLKKEAVHCPSCGMVMLRLWNMTTKRPKFMCLESTCLRVVGD